MGLIDFWLVVFVLFCFPCLYVLLLSLTQFHFDDTENAGFAGLSCGGEVGEAVVTAELLSRRWR